MLGEELPQHVEPHREHDHISGLDRLFDRFRAGQAAERARERRRIRFVPAAGTTRSPPAVKCRATALPMFPAR